MNKQSEFNVQVFNQRVYYQEDSLEFTRIYMKKNKEGYRIYCLGKSGEPKKKVKINVSFSHDWKNSSSMKQNELMTNSEGFIRLGKLENIKEISTYYAQRRQTWSIVKEKTIEYQSQVQIIEGQSMRFRKTAENAKVVMYSVKGETTQIMKEGYKVEKDVVLENMKEGEYVLVIGKHRIQIIVHKGVELYSNSRYRVVVTENNRIIQLQNSQNSNVCIFDSRVENNKLIVNTSHSDQKVTVIGFNFYDEKINDMLMKMENTMAYYSSSDSKFREQYNQFYNNKNLSDEMVYVLDRKNKQAYVGNYLEQPKILLNKKFNQKTVIEKEVLKDETAYSKCANMMND